MPKKAVIPHVIFSQPCRTTLTMRTCWSVMNSLTPTSSRDLNRRCRGRSIRPSARPSALVTLSLTSAAMKRANSVRPAAAAMTPPEMTERGRLSPVTSRAISAPTGRIIRARMFQTPVTMMEVEMARRETPQDRKAAEPEAQDSEQHQDRTEGDVAEGEEDRTPRGPRNPGQPPEDEHDRQEQAERGLHDLSATRAPQGAGDRVVAGYDDILSPPPPARQTRREPRAPPTGGPGRRTTRGRRRRQRTVAGFAGTRPEFGPPRPPRGPARRGGASRPVWRRHTG